MNTTEQIFMMRNTVEEVVEQNATVCVNFVDFENVFDSVHQGILRKIM